MSVKAIVEFASRFGAKITFDKDSIVKKEGRYFLLSGTLKRLIRKNYYYAGTYLGKLRNGKFFPSFILLSRLAKGGAKSVIVDRKTAWLFICGRDVFGKGILKVRGSLSKNDYAIVLNEFNECLGFGRVVSDCNVAGKGDYLAVKNVSDLGDFLRREAR